MQAIAWLAGPVTVQFIDPAGVIDVPVTTTESVVVEPSMAVGLWVMAPIVGTRVAIPIVKVLEAVVA